MATSLMLYTWSRGLLACGGEERLLVMVTVRIMTVVMNYLMIRPLRTHLTAGDGFPVIRHWGTGLRTSRL